MARQQKARKIALYVERLKEIEALQPPLDGSGHETWNVAKGQADFLGATTSGIFPHYYVLVEAEGLPTQEEKREESDGWVRLKETDLSQTLTGFWVLFLRISESQEFLGNVDREFVFPDLQSLQDFLRPMGISWYPALQAFEMLEGESYWSPDWRAGDFPKASGPNTQ